MIPKPAQAYDDQTLDVGLGKDALNVIGSPS